MDAIIILAIALGLPILAIVLYRRFNPTHRVRWRNADRELPHRDWRAGLFYMRGSGGGGDGAAEAVTGAAEAVTGAAEAVTGAAALADVSWSSAVPAGPVADELGPSLRWRPRRRVTNSGSAERLVRPRSSSA